jgi:hypothetical protein
MAARETDDKFMEAVAVYAVTSFERKEEKRKDHDIGGGE